MTCYSAPQETLVLDLEAAAIEVEAPPAIEVAAPDFFEKSEALAQEYREQKLDAYTLMALYLKDIITIDTVLNNDELEMESIATMINIDGQEVSQEIVCQKFDDYVLRSEALATVMKEKKIEEVEYDYDSYDDEKGEYKRSLVETTLLDQINKDPSMSTTQHGANLGLLANICFAPDITDGDHVVGMEVLPKAIIIDEVEAAPEAVPETAPAVLE